MIAGIDPGASGALAVIDKGRVLDVLDVPKVSGEVDNVAWARAWVPLLGQADHVWIERVHAMPRQGVTSMFNFGQRYGFVIGLVSALGIPVSYVRPAEWKRKVGVAVKADKAASRIRASELFPDSAALWRRKADEGKAEAALIAYHGFLCSGA